MKIFDKKKNEKNVSHIFLSKKIVCMAGRKFEIRSTARTFTEASNFNNLREYSARILNSKIYFVVKEE